MTVQPIPEEYGSVTPYLIVSGAREALDFYQRAFGAIERLRLPMPGGRIGHAEIQIGDSTIMLADEFPEMGVRSPKSLGGTPVGILLYVADADRVFQQAILSGAREEKPLQNQFYGDRSGTVIDPFGHKWTISTHIEDVSPEEINRRLAAMQPPS